jgi:hypothetical protein
MEPWTIRIYIKKKRKKERKKEKRKEGKRGKRGKRKRGDEAEMDRRSPLSDRSAKEEPSATDAISAATDETIS